MRAREADYEGYVEHDGVKIHYEVHGEGEPTLLLLPTFAVVHKQIWKGQVAPLARHFRVVTYDGPGNGRSERPIGTKAYVHDAQVAYALAVLEATNTDRAVLASVSRGSNWALDLAANHPQRVIASVFIGPMVAFAPPGGDNFQYVRFDQSVGELAPSRVPHGGTDPGQHWAKFNAAYWREHYEDFLWFFAGQAISDPHATKQREDLVAWGLETDPEVLIEETIQHAMTIPGKKTLHEWCERVSCPVLVIHGSDDRVSPLRNGERLAELTDGELLIVEGGGHSPHGRDPVQVNLAIRELMKRHQPPHHERRTWTPGRHRPKRVLYLSSPIGLGHARRDMTIARQLRAHHPDLEVDWLTQHPVTPLLRAAGERVHPASDLLVNESAHLEDAAGEHDLHCFQALRDMDEILVANFHVFHDLVSEHHYDLVVGDESWDVDHFLHEHPELKRFAYAWFTDFVGTLPMSDDTDAPGRPGPFGPPDRETTVTADVNAEMIEHIERFPQVRDRAIFVGDPEDVVTERFGEGLPVIRDWTREHYAFSGYVTGFDPATVADREALRDELGYRPDEQICIVTVGGSGVGGALVAQVLAAYDEAKRRIPALRMVVVAGPRLELAAVPTRDGLEVHAFVPDLYRHLACCDLAVVQGGLTTCMELTATSRPFIYIPLRHHFEQSIHVHHRLQRYGAGRRLDYQDVTPDHLAEAIVQQIGREVAYRPVETDGAARAAKLLAEML